MAGTVRLLTASQTTNYRSAPSPVTVLPLPTIINLLSLFLPASPVCPVAHPPAQVFFVPLRDGYFSFSYPDKLFAPVGQDGFSPDVPFRAPSLHPISGNR